MIDKEARTYVFSNNYVIQIGVENNNRYINFNGTKRPCFYMSLTTDRNIRNMQIKAFHLPQDARLIYEDYFCHVIDKRQGIDFFINVSPCSKDVIRVIIYCNGQKIHDRQAKISFRFTKAIQRYSLKVATEYKNRLEQRCIQQQDNQGVRPQQQQPPPV